MKHVNPIITVILTVLFLAAASASAPDQAPYRVKPAHPRLLIDDARELARRCGGPLADDYRVVKDRADAAVRRGGIEFISNGWSIPEDLMNCRDAHPVSARLRDYRRSSARAKRREICGPRGD